MDKRFSRLFLPAACLAAAVVGSAAVTAVGHSTGRPIAAPPAAVVVAVVDLEKVVDGLAERTEKEEGLKVRLKPITDKLQEMLNEANSLKKKLDITSGPEKVAVAKEVREKALRLDFEDRYAKSLQGEWQAEMLRDLYMKIDAAAEKLGKKNGYHLVLASDEKVEIPVGSNEDVNRTIALKRMLYVDPTLDVSDELVLMMNNDFWAAGGKAQPVPRPAKP